MTKERDTTLDFLKGVLIVLVVMFHLELSMKSIPTVVSFVYTFHMPAFLIISGFLFNINRNVKRFCKSIVRIAVPYLIFELIYLSMIPLIVSLLHASNSGSDTLSLGYLIHGLLIHPRGIYWYFHTILVCMCIYYPISKLIKSSKSAIIVTLVILFVLSRLGLSINFANVIYYMIGASLSRANISVTTFFKTSFVILIPLVMLIYNPENFDRARLSGMAITYCMISLFISIHEVNSKTVNSVFEYLGRNTLAIMCFSPIFTVLSKRITFTLPFDYDNVILIVLITTAITILCLASSYILDKLHLSKYVFLNEIYSPLHSKSYQDRI